VKSADFFLCFCQQNLLPAVFKQHTTCKTYKKESEITQYIPVKWMETKNVIVCGQCELYTMDRCAVNFMEKGSIYRLFNHRSTNEFSAFILNFPQYLMIQSPFHLVIHVWAAKFQAVLKHLKKYVTYNNCPEKIKSNFLPSHTDL